MYEVCVWGGDCILIIFVVVDDDIVKVFEEIVFELGMDVFLEVYDVEEFDWVLVLKFLFVGINN